jgi:polyhydroxybutyrate depolymerase
MRRAVGLLAAAAATLGSISVAADTTVAAAGPPESRTCIVDAGQRTETIDFQGTPRSYRVATPERPSQAPNQGPNQGNGLPLILNFHGLGSNATRQAVYSELEEKGPERGYVVLTPEGTGGRAFWNTLPNVETPDDVAFSAALIDTAREQLCIDPKRVYATGISNGAGMSTLLACDLSRRIAAIAPVAGVNLVEPCPRGAPVSVIAFHGEEDAVVGYEGGPCCFGVNDLDLVPVPEAVAGFAQRDGCRRQPVERAVGAEVVRYGYRGCDGGTNVVLYTVTNGGHTWPGSIDVPRLGHVTQDVNAADLSLDFFDSHARR